MGRYLDIMGNEQTQPPSVRNPLLRWAPDPHWGSELPLMRVDDVPPDVVWQHPWLYRYDGTDYSPDWGMDRQHMCRAVLKDGSVLFTGGWGDIRDSKHVFRSNGKPGEAGVDDPDLECEELPTPPWEDSTNHSMTVADPTEADIRECAAAGTYGVVYLSGGEGLTEIWKSLDGGVSWTYAGELPSPKRLVERGFAGEISHHPADFYGIFGHTLVPLPKEGYFICVGGETNRVSHYVPVNEIFLTRDGFNTWERIGDHGLGGGGIPNGPRDYIEHGIYCTGVIDGAYSEDENTLYIKIAIIGDMDDQDHLAYTWPLGRSI